MVVVLPGAGRGSLSRPTGTGGGGIELTSGLYGTCCSPQGLGEPSPVGAACSGVPSVCPPSACRSSAASLSLGRALPGSGLPVARADPCPAGTPTPSSSRGRGRLTARCVFLRLGLHHGHLLPHDALLQLRRAPHLRPGPQDLLPVRLQTPARRAHQLPLEGAPPSHHGGQCGGEVLGSGGPTAPAAAAPSRASLENEWLKGRNRLLPNGFTSQASMCPCVPASCQSCLADSGVNTSQVGDGSSRPPASQAIPELRHLALAPSRPGSCVLRT